MIRCKIQILFILVFLFFLTSITSAQFVELFEGDPASGWQTRTGDGGAKSEIHFRDGYGRIIVDGTGDDRNVWWAIMETTVSGDLDLELLARSGYELRVEARIRSSHAPRRINLHFNTQRTTDFHSHLMEFDIPDAGNWHTISMTTDGFDGRPGDTVNSHIALMDWGRQIYHLDVDYFKVDVVNKEEADPDLGEQVVYPPPTVRPDNFTYSEPAFQAAMIDRRYPGVTLSGWRDGDRTVLTTDDTKTIILRWDLEPYQDRTAVDYGMLELHPYAYYQATGTGLHEFDQVRLVEILDGDPEWIREEVTWKSFTLGRCIDEVFNTQMIVDIDMPEQAGEEVIRLAIPRPVIQRMLDGRTQGIAIYPLGALHASFYSGIQDPQKEPRLYMNLLNNSPNNQLNTR